MEPILAEAPTADAEGGGDHAGGGAKPPSGDDGGEGAVGEGGNSGGCRGATDRAPAAKDQATGGSSHPAAGEVRGPWSCDSPLLCCNYDFFGN